MKKIIFLIITILLVFIIYKYNYHSTKHILIIGDGISLGLSDKKITYNFSDELIKNYPSTNIQVIQKKDYRLRDLTTNIQNNDEFRDQKYQNLIKKSKYIILFIGQEEIITQLNSQISSEEIIANIKSEYEELITTIKQYNQNIAVINYYSIPNFDPSPINEYLNTLAKEYNIQLITINDIDNSTNYLTYQNQLLLFAKVNEFLITTCQLDKKI